LKTLNNISYLSLAL